MILDKENIGTHLVGQEIPGYITTSNTSKCSTPKENVLIGINLIFLCNFEGNAVITPEKRQSIYPG